MTQSVIVDLMKVGEASPLCFFNRWQTSDGSLTLVNSMEGPQMRSCGPIREELGSQ
jgi:hypothetical protein